MIGLPNRACCWGNRLFKFCRTLVLRPIQHGSMTLWSALGLSLIRLLSVAIEILVLCPNYDG